VSTEINALEMKQEPVIIKEENEDENIDVSSLTPTADQKYVGSPEHCAEEQPDSCVTDTQNNETSHLNTHSHPSSPHTTQPSSSINNTDGTSLSPTPSVDGDNAH
jgi:hypothetical protein